MVAAIEHREVAITRLPNVREIEARHLCMPRPRWRRLHDPSCAATGDFPWALEKILDRQLLAFESYMKCRPLNRTVLPLLDFKLSTQKRFLKARRKQKRSVRVETYWRTRDSMDVIDRFKDNLDQQKPWTESMAC